MNISLNRDMSTTTPIKKRGKKALYLWNGKDTSITELLTEPDVREFVSQGSTMTYASQRGRLRKLFKDGKITPKLVEEYVKKYPVRQYNVPDTLYGAQRRRANLHKKTKRGEVIYGPLLPPKPKKELRALSLTEKILQHERHWTITLDSVSFSRMVRASRRGPFRAS